MDGPNLYTYVVQNPWTYYDAQGLSAGLMVRGAVQVASKHPAAYTNPVTATAAIGGQAVLAAHALGEAIADPVAQAIHQAHLDRTNSPFTYDQDGNLVERNGGNKNPQPKQEQGDTYHIPAGADKEDIDQFYRERAEGNPNAQENLNERTNDKLNGGGGSTSTDNSARDVVVDNKAKTHILDGDKTGGGHRPGTGNPGKSEFPEGMTDEQIVDTIKSVADDPNSTRTEQSNGRTKVTGTRDGLDVTVITENKGGKERVVTGYPTNVPKNPKKDKSK